MDAIIIGSITQFGSDDKSTNIGGGALGGVTGRFGIGGVKRSKASAVVGVTARMINIDTAEILASESGKGAGIAQRNRSSRLWRQLWRHGGRRPRYEGHQLP